MEDAPGLVIAYYCTGHGWGHATRVVEVCKYLVQNGHTVAIVTAAPASVFSDELPPGSFSLRRVTLDTGAKQLDAFTVDQRGSLEDYAAAACARREELLLQEAAWLRGLGAALVVSDVVPLACAAAALAKIPCVAVTNFSWDFIYSEYVSAAGAEYRQMIWQIADDYACAQRLLRLPGYVPMPAFREVIDVPLVVRRARRGRDEVRASLGIPPGAGVALLMYGGQPAGAEWRLHAGCLPAGWVCVVTTNPVAAAGHPLPPNFVEAGAAAYTPDLVECCDVVVGKIGYGAASEALAHRRPLVFLRRDYFNEEPFLRRLLEAHECAVEMKRRDFLAGNWAPYLEAAARLRPHYSEPTNGAEVVAALLAQAVRDAAAGAVVTSPQAAAAGSTRLRDTIAWGYILGRHSARERVHVPEWYHDPSPGVYNNSNNNNNSSSLPAPAARVLAAPGGGREVHVNGAFTVVEGPANLECFEDTMAFLSLLGTLDCEGSPGSNARELPERRAARGLFRWEDEVFVARAPGRLDVMGGIADYSGALVLQMPAAEAAHAAVQRHPPGTQRVWRHMAARAAGSRVASRDPLPSPSAAPGTGTGTGTHPEPALRIVSLDADATNRGPAFDMALSELLTPDGRAPLPYAAARAYFRRDPALAWAAYVAGALVVLMHEEDVRPELGISVLVSSRVPEGKGVSSSAALEVAAMRALAAAHGVALGGRRLALLCQMVENLVVGAPCGVMDQMASALGRAGALLALRCQPAEVEPPVAVPPHLRFWGVDSGIRHSVGGSDYGAVRAGAFMGLRIASQLAHDDAGGAAGEEVEPIGRGYLANLPPSEFAARFERRLPEALTGADFLERYGPHWDAATSIDPRQTYAVRQPAAHAVHENFRVQAFRQILAAAQPGGSGGPQQAQQLEALGELMLQSHVSYGACGLGSAGTDRLVALVLEERAAAGAAGAAPALYGAKITGGGCGGTVCVVGEAGARGEAALRRVVDRYAAETSHAPQVFAGTSAGAVDFGVLRVLRRE